MLLMQPPGPGTSPKGGGCPCSLSRSVAGPHPGPPTAEYPLGNAEFLAPVSGLQTALRTDFQPSPLGPVCQGGDPPFFLSRSSGPGTGPGMEAQGLGKSLLNQ